MMITRCIALLLTTTLLAATTPAYAGGGGGGGTKRSSTIRFVNNSTVEVGVTTNANSTAIQTALTNGSLSQFQAAGGRVLNPGASTSFSVQAGTYTVGAANASGTSGTAITGITGTVTVGQGQTDTVTIINGPSGTNTIAFGSGVSSTQTVTVAVKK